LYSNSIRAALRSTFPDMAFSFRGSLPVKSIELRWLSHVTFFLLSEYVPRRKKRRETATKWQDVSERQKYFTDLAAELGFDAMDATEWATVTLAEIARTSKVNCFVVVKSSPSYAFQGLGPMAVYNSLKAALEDTFPQITIPAQGSTQTFFKRKRVIFLPKDSFFRATCAEGLLEGHQKL